MSIIDVTKQRCAGLSVARAATRLAGYAGWKCLEAFTSRYGVAFALFQRGGNAS
jgi:hypothetical protein